jgi:ribonuclease BN (tRNA processing enzyme)
VVVTVPWHTLNSPTRRGTRTREALGRVEVLLVTHGHFDHFAAAPTMTLLNQVSVYALGDMNQTVALLGMPPSAVVPHFNKRGTVPPVPGIKVTAERSSVIVWKNPATARTKRIRAASRRASSSNWRTGFASTTWATRACSPTWRSHLLPARIRADVHRRHFTIRLEDAAYAASE